MWKAYSASAADSWKSGEEEFTCPLRSKVREEQINNWKQTNRNRGWGLASSPGENQTLLIGYGRAQLC